MARYASAIHRRYASLQATHAEAEDSRSELLQRLQFLEAELSKLQTNATLLKGYQTKWLSYKQREPEIRKFLDTFVTVAKLGVAPFCTTRRLTFPVKTFVCAMRSGLLDMNRLQ
jgi:hypothetical protein